MAAERQEQLRLFKQEDWAQNSCNRKRFSTGRDNDNRRGKLPRIIPCVGQPDNSGHWMGTCVKTVLMHGDSFPDFKAENLRHWKYQVKLNEYLYACLAEEAALDAGVDLLYYSFPLEITENSGDAYWRIKVASRNETFDIGAKQIIDCSGSAAAASLAGFERMKESETQPGTLIFGISNYDFEALDKESLKKNTARP